MKSFESIAREAYTTFQESLPQQTPPWELLAETTRQAWLAAARKMADEIQQVH